MCWHNGFSAFYPRNLERQSMMPTRGELEAEFTRAMVQLEKEYLGRGPAYANTHLLRDMIIVRLGGILTKAELALANDVNGRELVKETRRKLFESAREQISSMVQKITGCQLQSLYTDVSTRSGERVIVLVVDCDFEQRFS